jgi:hypothetical protein
VEFAQTHIPKLLSQANNLNIPVVIVKFGRDRLSNSCNLAREKVLANLRLTVIILLPHQYLLDAVQ